jgi:hypothetical protein
MTANTPARVTWTQMAYKQPGLTEQRISEGTGEFRGCGPENVATHRRRDPLVAKQFDRAHGAAPAREHEVGLKSEKEQKARASVPQF